MANQRIFVTRKLPFWEEVSKPLYDAGYEVVVSPHNRQVTPQELMDQLDTGYDALLCLLTDKIDRAILVHSGRLKLVANYAVGFDNIDVALCKKSGIMVSNTPSDVVNESVAEFTWALILNLLRQVHPAGNFAKNVGYKGWEPDIFLGEDLSSKTLGIIGMGRIGSKVASKAESFGLKVISFSRAAGGTLQDVLSQADIVSLHVPLTPETNHMISSVTLEQMKRGAYLINTARGAVVDESDLLWALKSGHIAGAALDVWENEPNPRPELVEMTNVILTPHIASATKAARIDMGKIAVQNICAVLEGKVPPDSVK